MSDALEEFGKQPKPPQEATGTESAPASTRSGAQTSKKIIVCCDGTGNEFIGLDSTDKEDSNSNVVRLYTALKLDKEQYAYYHPGVGTMGDPSKKGLARWWSQVEGLAFGKGFTDNVLDAYRYLMQHYNAGDTVYLFGFSRGSYTARALAGLLHGYGLLCRGNEEHIPYAWRMYTSKLEDGRADNRSTIHTDFTFRDTFSHKDFMLHFVGLWDTVSSVGWVSEPLRLLHLAENTTIITIRHVISSDERRCFYQDNLYGKPAEVQVPCCLKGTPRAATIPKMQDLVQVWFPGVHSDVGGSYSQATSGLSTKSLEWMLQQAEAAGLVFDHERKAIVLGKTLTPEELKTSCTANLAALYPPPDLPGEPHDSLTWKWWPLEIFPHRYYTDDHSPEKMRIPLGAWRRIPQGAIVNAGVREHFLKKGPQYQDVFVQPAVNPGPTVADLSGFYQTTRELRQSGWRENKLVVFVVSLVEITVGLVAACYLLLALLHILSWLLQLTRWFGANILPADSLPCHFAKAASDIREWFVCHLGPLSHVWVWTLVVSFAGLLLRAAIVTSRNRKQKQPTSMNA